MWISRIARTDALYCASDSSQTSEDTDGTILTPIDSDEIVDSDFAKSTESIIDVSASAAW